MKPYFTITTDHYQHHHTAFMEYVKTLGYNRASAAQFSVSIRELFTYLEQRGITQLEAISTEDLQTFHHHLQQRPSLHGGGSLSESRITHAMSNIRFFFSSLETQELLKVNPASSLCYPKWRRKKRENLLSIRDIERLYKACENYRDRAMLGLLYGCGLRRGEAVQLNVKDVKTREGLLYVRKGKNHRRRVVPLSRKVAKDLKVYLYKERPLWCTDRRPDSLDSLQSFMFNKHGSRLQGGGYSARIKKLIRKAVLSEQITLHHLRHGIATHLLEGGMKLEQVKDFLGHQSVESTQIYTHITKDRLRKVISHEFAGLS